MGVPATLAPPSLPSLLHQAANRLESATNAAEVLEARNMARVALDSAKSAERLAKAKNAHDEVSAAARRSQADALEIIGEADRRLADEYDAAQKRGEVAGQGKPSQTEGLATVADIGLTHKEIHDAREIRDAEEADPGVVRRTLDAELAAGKSPTRAAIKRAVARPRIRLGAGDRQLKRLRAAWRAAGPIVREKFLTEINQRQKG